MPPTSRSTPNWVLALAAMASLMVALDALVVVTALDAIRLDLGASLASLEWTVNAYTLSFAVLLMSGAALGDRYGRRRAFITGLGLFVAASSACALAPSVGTLIAARAVQGAGAALVTPVALALAGAAFGPERRAWAMGIFSAITGIAVLAGPVVGGAIVEGVAWQWIFWLNVPIGLVVMMLASRRIDESFGPAGRIDGRGVLLVTAGAFGLVWGLVRGNAAGWGSLEVVGALVLGAACIAGFVAWERVAAQPMLPLRLFRSRAFAAGNAASFFLTSALLGLVFLMVQFLQVVQGDSPLAAGLRMLPLTATLFFVAPVVGARLDRTGVRPMIAGGLALQALGLTTIALIAGPDVNYAAFLAPLLVAGVGTSMVLPAAQSCVVAAVAPPDVGKASGTYNSIRQLGSAFGVAIAVAVFSGAGGYGSPAAFADGFVAAMGVAAALSFCGALAALALPARAVPPNPVPAAAPAPIAET